jgi:hypothetical protein
MQLDGAPAMATKRPRIMFTPSDRALAAIRRVATATEKPVSSVVAEQVEVLAEHLENLATVLELAKRMHQEEPQAVMAAARAAFEQMLPILDDAARDTETVFADLENQLAMFETEPKPSSSNTGATNAPLSLPKSIKRGVARA